MSPDTLTLGFARGVAPSKWARRWAQAAANAELAEGAEWPALELVPLPVSGRPRPGLEPDVLLERVAPGERPAGTTAEDRAAAPRRAVRLYAEAVALVVAADHELAGSGSADRDALDLVGLLAHPGHARAWPAPRAWDDPAWQPRDAAAALDLVAAGLGAILLPLPLARHLADKRAHAVLPVTGEPALPGTEIWASWAAERDDADVQRLVGILRGRTALSSRSGGSRSGGSRNSESQSGGGSGSGGGSVSASKAPPQAAAPKAGSGGRKSSPPKNSRGAQLAAAREKRAKRRGR